MLNYAICLLNDKIYNYTEKIVFYKNSWSFSNKNSLGSVQLIFSDFTSKWDLHHMESTVPIPLWLGLVWVLCKFQILHHETFLQWFHTLDHKTKNLSLFVVRIYLDFFFVFYILQFSDRLWWYVEISLPEYKHDNPSYYSYLQISEEERAVVWLFDVSYFYHHTPLTVAKLQSQQKQQSCCSHCGQYWP